MTCISDNNDGKEAQSAEQRDRTWKTRWTDNDTLMICCP